MILPDTGSVYVIAPNEHFLLNACGSFFPEQNQASSPSWPFMQSATILELQLIVRCSTSTNHFVLSIQFQEIFAYRPESLTHTFIVVSRHSSSNSEPSSDET